MKGAGRWLVIPAVLAVSGAMIYAQDTERTEHPVRTETPVAAPVDPGPVAAEPPADAPIEPAAGAPRIASAAEVEMLTSGAPPTSAQEFQFELPAGVAPEGGLQVRTIWAARAISVLFPQITTIGGFRQDALKWHPNGLAIDVMIPNHNSPDGIDLGNQIAGYALANAKRWGVLHVIWRQKIYPGVGGGNWTADYGSETANHYDHVHISTDGGGYPTGKEVYYIGSMRSAQ
ncbi:MAG TPA: glycoside hydrolase [Mycobacterium sp.]|nr:glycoside hydrolase [Mycobacterium sp.]